MRSLPRLPDIVIAGRVAAAAAGSAHPFGYAARTAHAWTETLYSRAQIRAERQLRSTPQQNRDPDFRPHRYHPLRHRPSGLLPPSPDMNATRP